MSAYSNQHILFCFSSFAITFDIYLWLSHTCFLSLFLSSNVRAHILLLILLKIKNKQLCFSVHVKGNKLVSTTFPLCTIERLAFFFSSTACKFRPNFLFATWYYSSPSSSIVSLSVVSVTCGQLWSGRRRSSFWWIVRSSVVT